MAGYKNIPTSAVAVGRATAQALWRRVRGNLVSHQARISDLESAPTLFPTGSVLKFAGAAAPTGWLLCEGQVVLRTAYADLFAIMSTSYNTGGEAGTDFRLPDGRGRVFVGAGTGTGLTARTLGGYFGTENHQLITAELPTHTHGITDPGHQHTSILLKATGGGATESHMPHPGNGTAQTPNIASTSVVTGVTIGNTGSDTAHNNMQPSAVLNWIVKS